MAVWETDDEPSSAAVASLPTPADTPYRTPSRASRKSRRSVTPPGLATPSPAPPLPFDKAEKNAKRTSKDIGGDEHISVLDPRRFTPTLHASLVSEILALRRDQEEKLKIIESLETTLHTAHQEEESLQATLSNTAKDSRSVKRQLALLEGGTSSALGELARERDEAVDAITETRKRLDTAQKKVRAQEDDSQRVHDLWAKEKDDWDEEKRKFERKLHVAESRLKVVLDEVADLQTAQLDGGQNGAESDDEDIGKDNDGTSIRTQSMTNSIRYSMFNGPGTGKVNGHSLADELNFDDFDDDQTDPDGRQSVLSHFRHNRNQSRDSVMSRTHRRNPSTDSQIRPGSVARGRLFMNSTVLERLEGDIREDDETQPTPVKVDYIDTGVQYSPPPSPELVPVTPSTPEPASRIEKAPGVETLARGEWEIEANQRRKRVHINKPVPLAPPNNTAKSMTSSAAQTFEPLSPPKTPKPPTKEITTAIGTKSVPAESKSIATQTDIIPANEQASTSAPLPIPSISIIPPTSRPTSLHGHRLPQYVKDVGCQVSILQSKATRSIAVQTDEIRIDRRMGKLPPHLHPSAISSRPTSPSPAMTEDGSNHAPELGGSVPRNPRRLVAKRSFTSDLPSSPPASPHLDNAETRDAYPGNNDDGPLSSHKAPMRRPHRISSLFAGFDGASSDEIDEFGDGDVTDTEFRTALSAPKPQMVSTRHSKRAPTARATTSPEPIHTTRQPASVMKQLRGSEVYSSFSLAEGRGIPTHKPSSRPADRSITMNPSSRAGVMRKAAMIKSGMASHHGRSRSPSLPDIMEPPFPIPTRASSRQPPFTPGAPSDGLCSPTRMGESLNRRGVRGNVYRSNSIRKVRSAAALPGNHRHRRRSSRSPPAMSPSEEAPESPSLPPLPSNDITSPRSSERSSGRYRSHRSQPSTNTAFTAFTAFTANTENTENTNMGSVGGSQQASGVVEAIAQTMVGEWMFKYVRRRKSFGIADTNVRSEENSNDRHRRWVWLAPYERAILWSSKQPVSGNALMGKAGRKLTIQSVLDVKDDNPAPKGSAQIFNRSILILTPQRALKFTAVSAERHYLWLTSLSFLAHSQQAVPEIVGSPTPALKPKPGPDLELSRAKLKRGGIRDSIRLTKGRHPAMTVHPDNTINASQLDDALTFNPEALPPIPSHQREISIDTAQPPFIPRFHDRGQDRVHERANQVVLHGRKRSNTGGHIPPPLSFRGFSGVPSGPATSYHASTNSTAGASVVTTGSSDIYNQSQASSNPTWGMTSNGSQRTSEASSRPPGNFFEAIGTVRMEAFISPLAFNDHPGEHEEWRHRARRRSKEARRRRSRSRHRDSYTSRGTRGTQATGSYAESRTGEEDYFRDDPFKGF
ncbi:Uu.00g103320.m01.CDS01 [Anthostomella pinea]|uniref:Uu.00g103320.m01.CDS01 n=1 Tax=Anthostomella pinea TaxID=933095 RepID=A0AAI8YFL4_9PEZI|nr:Uu.00g103320.m01.CDS01 [Anthostomella pinea]